MLWTIVHQAGNARELRLEAKTARESCNSATNGHSNSRAMDLNERAIMEISCARFSFAATDGEYFYVFSEFHVEASKGTHIFCIRIFEYPNLLLERP